MAPLTEPKNVLLPIKVDAFVFNRDVCKGKDEKTGEHQCKIAPITQPNYSFLRLKTKYLQSDITNDVDLHTSWPADQNSRFTDLGTMQPRRNRQGVYVHWTIPRVYRTGKAATESAATTAAQGMPAFPDVPTRWLVIRKIDDMKAVQPVDAQTSRGLRQVSAWVVESNRKFNIDDLGEQVDLQVDVSPYINAAPDGVSLEEQAEIFIGYKKEAENWSELFKAEADGGDAVKPQWIKNFSLMGSSNQLFPDYQPHCSNVFSIVDNFCYDEKENLYLTKASASYFVIGWNGPDGKDLFQLDGKQTRMKRLAELNMAIKGSDNIKEPSQWPKEFKDWLDATGAARTLCHGAVYAVQWDATKAPSSIPANDYARHLNDVHPIAIGTTPMDALMTYAGSHGNTGEGAIDIPDLVAELIKMLEKQLLARDDGVEAQSEAADMLYNWNYLRLDGGEQYHISGRDSSGKPKASRQKQDALEKMNKNRMRLDATGRQLRRMRWRLFSEWWKIVTLPPATPDEEELARQRVTDLRKAIDGLTAQGALCHASLLATAAEEQDIKPGALPPFKQQRDPTLLVGGVRSGWEFDYLKTLQIRLDSQVLAEAKTPLNEKDEALWSDLIKNVLPKLPTPSLVDSATALVREFALLESRRDDQEKAPLQEQAPLFHDRRTADPDEDGLWRDLWNDMQPWFPLFLEWEVEYTHISDEHFTLETRKLSHAEGCKLHYTIKKDVDLSVVYADRSKRDSRRLSGRVLILPQPTFSLEAKIKQLFSNTPPAELDDILDEYQREFLETQLYQLEFLSAPLTGFNSHLATVEQGNHVKPLIRNPRDGKLKVIKEAQREDLGLDERTMAKIDIESDVTPYGTSMGRPSGLPVFKPMVHGQFKITKLNIIDKFGQAIHAVDPTPVEQPPKVFPCISEWYAPQGGTTPNVIEPDKTDPARCEWVQVPPQLSQPARLNAAFVVPYKTPSTSGDGGATPPPPFWCAAHEWDNPIWGWVVVNKANYGLQLFLPNGNFYREVRRAGPNTTLGSPAWLPFAKPTDGQREAGPEEQQLDRLVQALVDDAEFLRRFIEMINRAGDSKLAPPSAYAEFRNALVGRPLALANMGWSLELATDAWESELTGDATPEKWLLPDPDDEKRCPEEDPGAPPKKPPRKVYSFPVKFGDSDRAFDGLVAYFKAKCEPKPGDALDLETIYTHFGSEAEKKPPKCDEAVVSSGITFQPIDPKTFPTLTAFWEPPAVADSADADEDYAQRISRRLSVFGALLDPFRAVHAYTGVQPVTALQLPAWTWQDALSRMTAFFHAGPVLVTGAPANWDPARQLTPEGAADPKPIKKADGEGGVRLAGAGAAGSWAWLQPYRPQGLKDDDEAPFMPLAVEAADEKARLKPGPYEALEGFLLMTRPPAQEEVPAKRGS